MYIKAEVYIFKTAINSSKDLFNLSFIIHQVILG